MFKWLKKRRQSKDAKRIADLEAERDALARKLEVAETEIESLSLVVYRDRARVEAELAAYNRQKAEAEGMKHNDDGSPEGRNGVPTQLYSR